MTGSGRAFAGTLFKQILTMMTILRSSCVNLRLLLVLATVHLPSKQVYGISFQRLVSASSPRPCYLHPSMRGAALSLIATLSPSNLGLVFQTEVDKCLLKDMWSEDVPAKIVESDHIRTLMENSSYRQPLQFLLVGDIHWISHIMALAKDYYLSARINAKNTHWLWIMTSPGDSACSRFIPNLEENTNATEVRCTSYLGKVIDHQEVLSTLSSVLIEGMRGVLAYRKQRTLPVHTLHQMLENYLSEWVNVASVLDPGDGSWDLKLSATWTQAGMRIVRPLWPSESFDLRGRILRINVLKKPTVFLFNDGDSLAEAEGYAADLAKLLQVTLNFSAVLVPNTGFGAYNNGTWNGMVGDLYRGEADVSPMDFTPIWQRTSVIDFGIIYSTDNVVIISQAPSIFIKPLLLVEIFTPAVWACLVGVGIVAGVGVWTLLRTRQAVASQKEKHDAMSYSSAMLKMLVFQGSKVWPSWTGGRVVSGTVMLQAVIIGSVYSGSITAFLAIPFRSVPINSLEDLLDSKAIPAVRTLSSPYNFFLTEDSGVVGESVRKVMETFSGTEMSKWNFLRKVAEGRYGFIDTASSAVGRSGQFEERSKPCLFHVGRNPVRMDLDAFAYPKNSPVKHQFDESMRWLRSYGIIESIKGKFYSKTCSPVVASDGPRPISVIQAQGAFYVLGVGLALAVVSFLAELAVTCIQ